MNLRGYIQSLAAVLPVGKELLGEPNKVMDIHSRGPGHSKGLVSIR